MDEELSYLPPEALAEMQRMEASKLSTESNQEDNAVNPELNLSPEVKDLIMSKLCDIDEYGTAFTSIRNGVERDRLQEILNMGLLGNKGTPERMKNNPSFELRREALATGWAKSAREWDIPGNRVWFNIVGRISGIKGPLQIKQTHMANYTATLILDISKHRELPPGTLSGIKEVGRPDFKVMNTFSSESDRGKSSYYFQKLKNGFDPQSNSNHQTDQGTGFSTPFRISQGKFKGIVVDVRSDLTVNEVIDTMKHLATVSPEKCLPVYDLDGNMIWPETLSYSEIKETPHV